MERSPPQPRDWTTSSAPIPPPWFDATDLPRLSQLGAPRRTTRLDQLAGRSFDLDPEPFQLQPSSDVMPSHGQPKRERDLQDGDEESPVDTPSSKRRRRLICRQGVRTASIQTTFRRLPDPRIAALARSISQEDFSHLQALVQNRGTNPPPQSRFPFPAPNSLLGRHPAVDTNHASENEDSEVEFIGSRSAINSMADSPAPMPPATPQTRPTAPTQAALQALSSAPVPGPFSSPFLQAFDSSPLPAPLSESFDSSPLPTHLPAPLPPSRLDRQRPNPPSLRVPPYAAEVENIATHNDRPHIMAAAQLPPIASQNNEDVRFSTVLSITQSLSVLDQIMPTHWVRRGITLHEDLRSWLTADMQRPLAGNNDALRNCACAVDIPKKFYFAGCRHMACGDCARKSGRCCDRDQSMVLCYPPEGAECPICEDVNPILIFKCGHTMCQPCYLQLASQPGNTLCPQCRADLGYGAIARFNPA